MEVNEVTLIEALKYIQEVCKDIMSSDCSTDECAIYRLLGHCCTMEDSPESWKVNEHNSK
jgi:hypothetical protein